jgi:hypothetical protein
MNDNACEYKVEPLVKVLLAVAGLLGAFIFLQIATFVVSAGDAAGIVAGATDAALGKRTAVPSTEIKSAVEGLKKNNLFAPRAPKQYPINEVIGILGNQALINGQWYKVGDTVAEAKILAIEPTKVKVTWNGEEKEFMPIGSTGGGGPESPGPGRKGRPQAPSGAPMVVTGDGSGPSPVGPMAGLSSEERDRLRERWTNMSPDERQRYREEMRGRFGRRDQ